MDGCQEGSGGEQKEKDGLALPGPSLPQNSLTWIAAAAAAAGEFYLGSTYRDRRLFAEP